jgi:phenylalanyl-tRNA synthetase alpha chain
MKAIDTKELLGNLEHTLKDSLNETQIIEAKNAFTNKYLSPIYGELKLASIDEKKEIGNFANIFKNQINDLTDRYLNKIKLEKENSQHKLNYDINIDNVKLVKGGLTPLTLITNEVIEFFKYLNFEIVSGDEIVSTKYNFDHLNIGPNHPARGLQDSFFINQLTMLRTHCTSVTAEMLDGNKSKDIRLVTYGNVYRNDEDDATHSHQFNQVDLV